jgi:spore coat protein U-like protein
MNRRNLAVLVSTAAALAAFVLAAVPARAATTSTGIVTVKATVAKTCVLSSPTLDFAAYDPTLGSNLDQSTSLTVNCTKGTAWVVGLNQGANGPATRNMKDTAGTDLLNYELYTDAAHTNVWTNGTTASATVASNIGNGVAAGQTVTIFGRIFKNQYVTASTYQDAVTATVNF